MSHNELVRAFNTPRVVLATAMEAWVRDGASAAVPAALLSGLPSTLSALVRRRDAWEAAAAAGAVVAPWEQRRPLLVVYAIPVHFGISVFWSIALARVLPRRGTLLFALAGGGVIAAVDLAMVGRHLPPIRALPQVLDHLAFGAVVGAVVAARRARRPPPADGPLGAVGGRTGRPDQRSAPK